MSYGKNGFANYREHLNYLEQHGEFAADGRPKIEEDRLLARLREVHGEPRFDLFQEAKYECR